MLKDILNLKANPYICVPITGETDDSLLKELDEIIHLQPDIIEWRADFYKKLHEFDLVLNVLKQIKEMTSIPVLFTIRSAEEGGEVTQLDKRQEMFQLLEKVCQSSNVALIDIEVANDDQLITPLINIANEYGVKTILSYHNFKETPKKEKLMQIGERVVQLKGDLIKIAVMPQTKSDVLDLLHVTDELDQKMNVPVATMSMGELGAISRVIGWTYGSIITFAVGKRASAPGQLPIRQLRETIQKTADLLNVK